MTCFFVLIESPWSNYAWKHFQLQALQSPQSRLPPTLPYISPPSLIYPKLTKNASYLIFQEIVYICISEKSYPRKLAFTYLSDLSNEFSTTYPSSQTLSPSLRPYAFMEFDTFISRTKATYSDTRATQNLDKLNDELRDVTKVMTKNIEDLLYRGDSLERMGEVSSRLREDSAKYRRAAVRINWELLLKQYGPLGGLGLFILIFIWWRFF